jgi:hypothetical protein
MARSTTPHCSEPAEPSGRHVSEGELSQFLLLGRELDRLALEEETPRLEEVESRKANGSTPAAHNTVG